jgi:uncharacterized protein (DUF1778 family)
MATLETQYENYLKENPNSDVSFETWKQFIHLSNLKLSEMKMSEKDIELIISKINSPDEPNDELKRAFLRYKETIKK